MFRLARGWGIWGNAVMGRGTGSDVLREEVIWFEVKGLCLWVSNLLGLRFGVGDDLGKVFSIF